MSSDNRKTIHLYFVGNEPKQFDTFIESMRKIGVGKVRRGDITTAIMRVAMKDDSFISKVRSELLKGGE